MSVYNYVKAPATNPQFVFPSSAFVCAYVGTSDQKSVSSTTSDSKAATPSHTFAPTANNYINTAPYPNIIPNPAITVTGTVKEAYGGTVTDSGTNSQTSVSGLDNTVVLVLNYGTFTTSCADLSTAQSLVSAIYTAASPYLAQFD